MSYDGFFELLYNGKNILQTESNNPEDMGTFNYYSPTSETDGHKFVMLNHMDILMEINMGMFQNKEANNCVKKNIEDKITYY